MVFDQLEQQLDKLVKPEPSLRKKRVKQHTQKIHGKEKEIKEYKRHIPQKYRKKNKVWGVAM